MPEGMWRNLGQALSLVRQIRRRSQTSVADEAGLGKSQLSKYAGLKITSRRCSGRREKRLVMILDASPDRYEIYELVR